MNKGAKLIKLNSLTGAAWGQRGTLSVPVGPTYEEIILKTNAKAEEIERVAVNLNGEEIYIVSGLDLVMLEKYKNRDVTAGMYVIPFADISCRTKLGVQYTGLVTELTDNITLEVQFKSKKTGVQLSIECWGQITQAQSVRTLIPRLRTLSMQATAQGENEFTSLTSGPLIAVRRMHFKNSHITNLKVTRDFIQEYEACQEIAKFTALRNERIWQDGYFHFDPIVRGFALDELFKTERQSELKFTVNVTEVAMKIPILVESVEVTRPEFFQKQPK